MQVISLIGQKGGTGKTKLAQILVVAFERSGVRAAGIDLDPQTSFYSWGELRQDDAPPIIATSYGALNKELDTARSRFDVCIIDTAGRAEQTALHAARAADLVLVPVQPTPDDLMTIEATQDVIGLAKNPPAAAVLTRVKPYGTRHEEAAEYLKKRGLEVCPATIGDRVIYHDAGAAGLSPEEYDPQSKAADECAALFAYVRDRLKGTAP